MATFVVERTDWRRISVASLVALGLAGAALGLGTAALIRSGEDVVIREAVAPQAPAVAERAEIQQRISAAEAYAQTSSAAVRERGAPEELPRAAGGYAVTSSAGLRERGAATEPTAGFLGANPEILKVTAEEPASFLSDNPELLKVQS